MSSRWSCASCGEEHVGLPLDFGFDAPAYWDGPHSDADYLDADLCVWTDAAGTRCHFVRGVLELPVPELRDRLAYGVWGSLSERSFDALRAGGDADAAADASYFSWLSNSIPGYPETLSLPARVAPRAPGLRPAIVVVRGGDHPLVREQEEGVGVERVRELAGLLLHR